MLDYARSDTHYLLFVYDNMRNELIERSDRATTDSNLVDMVLRDSKGESLQRFEWPVYDSTRGLGTNGWYKLLHRTPALFSREQFAVFRAVHQWRDAVAREEDESLHYVMPKQVMFNIATSTPVDISSLLGVSHPISQPMRSRVQELLDIVREAKEAGKNGPEMEDLLQPQEQRAGDTVMAEASPTTIQAPRAQPHAAATTIERAPGEVPFRTNSSRFWGSMFGSSLWQPPQRAVTSVTGLQFAFPLPQLTAEVFQHPKTGGVDTSEVSHGDRAALTEHQYQKVRELKKPDDEGIFVIKQMGSARKMKTTETQGHVDSTSIHGNDSTGNQSEIQLDDEQAQSKALRKAERKAQKKLKKEQAQTVNGTTTSHGAGTNALEPTEAFDYANAESVLHAKRDYNDRSAPKKVFDPYVKSMDAPKGMRKTQREIAGKSFTFPK